MGVSKLKMKPDQERVKNLLTDTISMLCRNGLAYNDELKIEGLLGITIDNNEVFLININDKFGETPPRQAGGVAEESEESEDEPIMIIKEEKSDAPPKPISPQKRPKPQPVKRPSTNMSQGGPPMKMKAEVKNEPGGDFDG